MSTGNEETFIRIGEVIDWIFRDGISLDHLQDNPTNLASESED